MAKGSPAATSAKDTVLVTGVSGLLGARVCRELSSSYRVIGLDVKRPEEECGALFVECDLTDDAATERALGEVARHGKRIASVIHLAAYYDFSGEPSPLYDELTVNGTRRLLRGLQRFEVTQFVFSSSLLVMRALDGSERPGARLDEESPVDPGWDYPRSKLDAERVIGEERGDIPAVVLRIAGVYDEDGHSLPIAQQVWRIHGKTLESFFFPGNAEHGQPFVHLEDLMRCFRAVVERRAKLGPHEVLLVGEPAIVSYGELQDHIGEAIHGREWPTIRIPKPLAKAGAWLKDKAAGSEESFIKPWMVDLADAHRPISIERARRLVGWKPRHSLLETLPEMLRRLLADPRAWYERNGLELPKNAVSTDTSGGSAKSSDSRSAASPGDLDAHAPPWHRNPSSWRERVPICVLASVAFVAATWMALYQWGVVDFVWDPWFGEETYRVLDSDVSGRMRRWFGIPDAALGALAYLGDVIFALAGCTRRWQYRPWLVILFGIDVIPLGIVSAVLVGMQGTVVGAWCFLCLVTAVISLVLVVLAYDEVWSSIVYLRSVWRKERSLRVVWERFWGRAPARKRAPAGAEPAGAMWARDMEVVLGLWLIASPFLLGHAAGQPMRMDLALGGAILVLALLSYWHRARRAHLAELAIAAWLVLAGWLAAGESATPASQNHVVVGLLLAMLAILPSEANRPPIGWRLARRASARQV